MGDIVRLAVGRVRPRTPLPKPRTCIACDDPIETARQQLQPGAIRCVACQHAFEVRIERQIDAAGPVDVVIIRRR